MSNFMYNRGKKGIMDASIDLDNDTLKVLLIDNAGDYIPNPDHDNVSDVVANEMSGGNYSRQLLANVAITEDDSNDLSVMDADDVTFASISAGTAKGAIIFKDTGNDATSPLIAWIDTNFPITTNGGDIIIQWSANGILAF